MIAITLAHLLYAGLLATSIAGAAGILRLLSFSGALAAFAVGFFVFGFGGFPFAIPLLAFFFSSSLLSRIGRARKAALDAEYAKSSTRDAAQVLANGAVPALLALAYALTPNTRHIMLLYLAALAAVNADTWATEIGGLMQGSPFLVTTFKRVRAGTSGAVSLGGLAASLLGSLFIVGTAWAAWPPHALTLLFRIDLPEVIAIAWAGFVAAYGDSILGATVQAQYRCPRCSAIGERPEHCGIMSKPVRGLRWMTNDAVNLITSVLGVLFAEALLRFFAYPLR